MYCIPVIRAKESGVFPEESIRLKFTGMDFDSLDSEIKQWHVSPSKHPLFVIPAIQKPSEQSNTTTTSTLKMHTN
jgi:hypothetical protein